MIKVKLIYCTQLYYGYCLWPFAHDWMYLIFNIESWNYLDPRVDDSTAAARAKAIENDDEDDAEEKDEKTILVCKR